MRHRQYKLTVSQGNTETRLKTQNSAKRNALDQNNEVLQTATQYK